MLTIRASRVPLLLRCGQSIRGEIEIRDAAEDDGTMLGSAVHLLLAMLVRGGPEVFTVEEIAEQFDVSSEDLGRLYAYGRQAWETIKPAMPDAIAEVPLGMTIACEDLRITGMVDVMYVGSNVVRVLDWKSGWGRGDWWNQVATYGMQAAAQTGVETAQVSLCWLRYGEIDTRTLSREAMMAHLERIKRAVSDPIYQVGSHCDYCMRGATCLARRESLAVSVRAFVPAAASVSDLVALGRVAEVLATCSQVEAVARKLRDEIKAHVESVGGELLEHGYKITLEERHRRKILARPAWETLCQYLGDEIDEAITVSASKAETIAARHARRGSKGAVKSAFMAALDGKGALEREVYKVLLVKEASDDSKE